MGMSEIQEIVFCCGLAIKGVDIFNGLEIKDIKCPFHGNLCLGYDLDRNIDEETDEKFTINECKEHCDDDKSNNDDKKGDKNVRL